MGKSRVEYWASQESRNQAGDFKPDVVPGWHGKDRLTEYRDWRRTRGHGLYACDVDYVEYRYGKDGKPFIVATLELTRTDDPDPIGPMYRESILARYNERDGQGTMARLIADQLGVECFLVLYRNDLSQFFVYNLSHPRGKWWCLTQERYEEWLSKLPITPPLRLVDE